MKSRCSLKKAFEKLTESYLIKKCIKYQDQKALASPTNPANKGDATSQEICSDP